MTTDNPTTCGRNRAALDLDGRRYLEPCTLPGGHHGRCWVLTDPDAGHDVAPVPATGAPSSDMTTTSPTAESSLNIPLRQCAPWCRDGDGHPRQFPVDRYCTGPDTIVPLTRAEAISEYDDENKVRTFEYDHLKVNVYREVTDEIGWISMSHEGAPGPEEWRDHPAQSRNWEAPLTPAEARQLAEALTRAADLLEGGYA